MKAQSHYKRAGSGTNQGNLGIAQRQSLNTNGKQVKHANSMSIISQSAYNQNPMGDFNPLQSPEKSSSRYESRSNSYYNKTLQQYNPISNMKLYGDFNMNLQAMDTVQENGISQTEFDQDTVSHLKTDEPQSSFSNSHISSKNFNSITGGNAANTRVSTYDESGVDPDETKEERRVNKNFEANILGYMFKQWGIEWDLILIFTNFIRGDIDSNVSLYLLTFLGFQE